MAARVLFAGAYRPVGEVAALLEHRPTARRVDTDAEPEPTADGAEVVDDEVSGQPDR